MNFGRSQYFQIRLAIAQTVKIAACAFAVGGCQRSNTEVMDKDLAAVRDFVVTRNKVLSNGGDITILSTVTSINPKQMSVMLEIFEASTPEIESKAEFIFRWDQLRTAVVITNKYFVSLSIRLEPEGVMRVFESEEGYWRRGATPTVEFSFSTQAEALKFFDLFSVAARKFGAKDLSSSPRLVDNRNPSPMSPKRKADFDKRMKAIKNDPGLHDRLFPREK